MHGVTGRMGTNQHLVRSILEIRKEGGVRLADGTRLMPDPILAGRNADKLRELARAHGIERWTTDLGKALADRADTVFFDAASTQLRPKLVKQAIAAGKHVYCEKPVATTLAAALDIYRAAKKARVRHGVVQDKLWLPGLLKLKKLADAGFFGRILSVRGEFGYWVFEGDTRHGQPAAQRPSWNYRLRDGGGIILDMLCHWRYVLDNLFGAVQAVTCRGATHIAHRWDENGRKYRATADDAAYATFELAAGRSRISQARGACGCGATISSPCRWTARRARRSPGCGTVSSSPTEARPSPCGIPTFPSRSISSGTGTRCRTIRRGATRSRRSGSST